MSKIDCGTLTLVRQGNIEFRGEVQLGSRLDGTLVLRKHRRAGSSGDSPDYSIEYKPRNGNARPLGAAWLKNGERAGDFVSMTLDDPDWSAPTYLTAFAPAKDRGETSWVIVWTRPRGARVQDEPPSPEKGG